MRLYLCAVLIGTMIRGLVAFSGRISPIRLAGRKLSSSGTSIKSEVQIIRGKEWFCEQGDPLVFSGAIAKTHGRPSVGDEVLVKDHQGSVLGRGMFNPYSMYRVRVIASKHDTHFDAPLSELIKNRISQAVSARGAMLLPRNDTDVFRLVNSEGDRLSGVIIDVIGSTVVVQSSALWVELQKDAIESALRDVPQFQSKTILWRRALTRLNQDGLKEFTADPAFSAAAAALGIGSDDTQSDASGDSHVVTENGVKYKLCAATDQKTGFYCDQRENRLMIRSMSRGKTVLDAYCYTGGFTLNAMTGGAAQVTSIDSSARAIESLSENLALNGFASFNDTAEAPTNNKRGQVELVKGEAEQTMLEMINQGRTFDMVICDPPKLAPKRADLPRATRKYKQINTLAMQLVSKKGGLLLTCTCSAAMTHSGKFEEMVQSAARAAGRDVMIVSKSGAAPDHPTVVACPESNYLTALLLYVY